MRRIEHIFMVRCWRLILRQHRKILKCIFEIYMFQQRNMLGRKILNNSKLIRFSEISLRSYNFSTIRNCLIGKNVNFTFTKFTSYIACVIMRTDEWWVVEVWMSKVWGFIYVIFFMLNIHIFYCGNEEIFILLHFYALAILFFSSQNWLPFLIREGIKVPFNFYGRPFD